MQSLIINLGQKYKFLNSLSNINKINLFIFFIKIKPNLKYNYSIIS